MSQKQSHRRNRDGKVWQRASDGRWCARVYPPVEMGGKSRLVYGRSWEEADRKRRDLEAELAQGLPGDPDQPLERWMSHWLGEILPSRVAAGNLAQSTLNSYRDNTEKHILPALGAIPLRKLSVSRVRQWEHELIRKPSARARRKAAPGEKREPVRTLSLRTVAYCHAILRAALNDAIKDELLTRNVAILAGAPSSDAQEIEPLTRDDVIRLLAATGDDSLQCYWIVLLALGLRRGEALALRWQDIDFDAASVKISGSIQRVRTSDGSKLERRATKTRASRATIPVGPGVLEALREHQRRQRKQRMASVAWLDTGLVFTTSVGSAIEPRNVNRAWDAVCRRAGVKARIHDLRHACGTHLAAEGVPQKAIQSLLRHRRITTTDLYMHALEDATRGAVTRMDALVTGYRQAGGTTS